MIKVKELIKILPSFFLEGPQMNANANKDTRNKCFKHVDFIDFFRKN